jgi:hypothetical protein
VSFLFLRRNISIISDLDTVRIVIPYWHGWPSLLVIVFWNIMNIQMGYWIWHDISIGCGEPRSWDKLHLSEICAVFGLCIFFWLVAGREVLTITSTQLRLRREILGIGWFRNYALSDVKDIRAGGYLDPGAKGRFNFEHVTAGLYFDCGGKTYGFGNEITLKDALRIETDIRGAFPQVVLGRNQIAL